MFAARAPITGTPYKTADAFGCPRSVTCFILWLLNDLRGTAKPVMGKQSPAYVGACSQCRLVGVRLKGAAVTIYPGAITHTKVDSDVRRRARKEFAQIPPLLRYTKEAKAAPMTHEDAVASGRRAESSGNVDNETHHGVSLYVTMLGYFDLGRQVINDPMHEIANTVKDVLHLLMGRGGQRFTTVRRNVEQSFGRFIDQPAFWRVPKETISALDELVANLRLPTAWPDLNVMFEKLHRMKSADALLFAGPLGVYLLQCCEFQHPDGKEKLLPLLVDLMLALELVQARTQTEDLLRELQTELVHILSELEVMLPLCWSTNVRHVLLHLVDFIRRCGPFHCHSMLSFERWHTVFKKLAAGTHDIMASIRNHYDMLSSANAWQCPSQAGMDWVGHPHRSTVYGRLRPPGSAYGDFTYKLASKPTPGVLETKNGGSFVQVQDIWAVDDKDYDQLRDRYRRDRRQHARNRNQHWLTSPMLDPEWRPRTGPSLNQAELDFMLMTPAVQFYRHVCTGPGDKVRFAAKKGGVHDDSIVKTWYLDNGEEHVAYGQIQRVFTHSIYPGGRKEVVVECEWLEPVLDESGKSFLPLVRRNPDYAFNKCARFTFLRQCAAYNIMIVPHDPWDQSCELFDVVDRWRTYEDHSLSTSD